VTENRPTKQIAADPPSTSSRAASRGFADPWSMGWYCTGCGPMGSTKDKRPMRVPDRTVRDGRYVFTCPVHGEIPVRWPNG
jgi:hypothetical protein